MSASDKTNANPRATESIPNVVISELMPTYVTRNPLSSPTAAPAASATNDAPIRPSGSCSTPITTPHSAAVEATDRSRPPLIISMVVKTAMMPIVELNSSRLLKLRGVKNTSESDDMAPTMRASMMIRPINSCKLAERSSPPKLDPLVADGLFRAFGFDVFAVIHPSCCCCQYTFFSCVHLHKFSRHASVVDC